MSKFIVKLAGETVAEVEGNWCQVVEPSGTLLIFGEAPMSVNSLENSRDPLGERRTAAISGAVAVYKAPAWDSCEKEIKEGVKTNAR